MRIWLPAIRVGSGADVFTDRLASALRARHIDVEQTWFHPGYEFLPELMRLQPAPPGTDLIHANSWNASAFLGRGIPVVATVHHLVHDPAFAPYRSIAQAIYHRWHVRWREQLAVANADQVTAVSTYVAGTVRDVFGREDVRAIPNWVDTERYSPSQGHASSSHRPFRLLMVGNLGRRKGADLLVPFAEALGRSFELYCTGGLRGNNVEAARNIQFLGRVPEDVLIRHYQDCDAVVSLSRYEGFGYTALEGMACGKPFVGFRTSGLAEVVEDGVTGFLEPIDDVLAFAQRCRSLAGNQSMLQAMSASSRERAVSKFSESTAMDAYVATYSEAIRQRGE